MVYNTRSGSAIRSLYLKRFCVWISSGGDPMPVYQVTSVDERTRKCYIPSQAGEEYEVAIMPSDSVDSAPHNAFHVRLYADGSLCASQDFYREPSPSNHSDSHTIRHRSAGEDREEPLVFSSVKTPEEVHDAELSVAEPVFDDPGLIEVRVWHAKRTEGLSGPTYKKIGRSSHPEVVFQFYHQPLESLEAAGIAPIPGPALAPRPSQGANLPLKRSLTNQDANAEGGPSKRRRARINYAIPPPLTPEEIEGLIDQTKKSKVKSTRARASLKSSVYPTATSVNAEAGPSTHARRSPIVYEPEEDVKPRLTEVPNIDSRSPTFHIPRSPQDGGRAAHLRAQIAAREIRVKRLAEEEQLALEKAELAALEDQAQLSLRKRKEKERERRSGGREVIDLTLDG